MDQIKTDTIEQLEARLQRIEYVTSGHYNGLIRKDDNGSASTRLRNLEQGLIELESNSRVIQDLWKLHARHPGLFYISEPCGARSSLEVASKSSTVLAAASSFHQTASRLTSVKDTPLPAARASSQLIDAVVRTAKSEALQESQLLEIAALKQRSAAVIQRWYSVDILQVGECWADLEARVEFMEQVIRRVDLAKQNEEGRI